MVVTGPVGKHFGNLESYPVHNQIHGLVLIESKSLVTLKKEGFQKSREFCRKYRRLYANAKSGFLF